MKKQTKAIHTQFQREDAYGSLSMPVYHTAAYEFANAHEMIESFCGRSDSPDYSRVMNPTVTFFEQKVKSLTGAQEVIAFSSGMAAVSNTFFALASAGKNIVSSSHMFANTYALLTKTLRRFGIEAKLCDLTDLTAVERSIDKDTCCLYLETITNPQMEVADLRALAEIAHRHGIPLVADSTLIPFTECDLHSLGVDIEMASSTKYLSGGATSIGGLIMDYGTVDGFSKTIRQELLLNLGAYMTPHVAYMQALGLETMDARYRLQAANALQLATMLCSVPAIRQVNYVGLPDNPFHHLAKSQFGNTAGAMLTIKLADEQTCFRFLNRLQLVRRATNLFDNKTLAIHPASTIYGNFTAEERRSMDVSDAVVRLSVGLEDMDDILADILQALET